MNNSVSLVGQHLSRSLLVPVLLSLLICLVSALGKGESHFTKAGRRSMPPFSPSLTDAIAPQHSTEMARRGLSLLGSGLGQSKPSVAAVAYFLSTSLA